MIVVTVEHWPHSEEAHKTQIARLQIANVGLVPGGGGTVARYDWAAITTHGGHVAGDGGTVQHNRDDSVWQLIAHCLADYGVEVTT